MVNLKEELSKLVTGVTGKRNYGVCGSIIFEFWNPTSIDLPELKKKILQVDNLFPWRDRLAPRGKLHSIGRLTEGEYTDIPGFLEGHLNPTITFHLHPPEPLVSGEQIFGYQNYLRKLAAELIVDADIDHLTKVSTILEVVSGYSMQRVQKKPEE